MDALVLAVDEGLGKNHDPLCMDSTIGYPLIKSTGTIFLSKSCWSVDDPFT